MTSQAKVMVEAAITELILGNMTSFSAAIALHLEPRETKAVQTLATDGKCLYWNPDYVKMLTLPELCSIIVEETFHVAGLHPWRREWREPHAWNVACDQRVNALVQESGFMLVADSIPPDATDRTPEQLYDPASTNDTGKGVVLDSTGNTQEAIEQAKQWICEAQARAAGNMPAGLERFIGNILKSRVPWQAVLQRFVATVSRDDYTWSYPNRRFVSQGIALPSLRLPKLPEVMFWSDTSGSVDSDTLERMVSEALAVMATLGAEELHVGWCDAEPHTQYIRVAKDFKPVGGGGTMYSPAFAWVQEHAPETEAVIYATDGLCANFGPQPEADVLWLLVGDNTAFSPPWGEVVRVN